MIKPTLIFFITWLSFPCFSQCEYERDEIDDMTGDKVVETTSELILNKFGGTSISVSATMVVSNSDTIRFLTFTFTAWSIFSMDEDNKILIKLENGEIIELKNAEYLIAETGSFETWEADIDAFLTYENFIKLSKNPIVKIRFYFNDGYVEEEIRSSQRQRQLSYLLWCLYKA